MPNHPPPPFACQGVNEINVDCRGFNPVIFFTSYCIEAKTACNSRGWRKGFREQIKANKKKYTCMKIRGWGMGTCLPPV